MKNRKSLLAVAGLLVLGISVAIAAPKPSPAAGTAKADQDKAVAYLKKTQKGVEAAVKGLSAEQLKWKAAPDRWSVQDCLEHITLSEDYLRTVVTDKVLKSPAAPDKVSASKQSEGDEMIMKRVTDRSHKAQAPEPLKPSGKWADSKAMLKEFSARRAATIQLVRNSPENLRAHFMDSPAAKDLDGVQWILFLAAHSERHTAQMLEVKADPNFPKK
ncbi:MAG: DinB family protein [Acidobacteria bacterium]|nr:DinB family protein [Acidobacteriota bacterium]